MLHRTAPAAALAALLTLASCAGFSFGTQELALRPIPEEDAFELLLVYEGVVPHGEQPADLERAVRTLARITEGRRQAILLGWPFEFDLDDDGLFEHEAESAQRLRAYADNVELLDVGLARDGERLILHQRFRFGEASAGLEILNAAWSEFALELGRTDDLEEALDPRSAELWVQHAQAGRDWLVLDESGLELRIPASSAGAARLVRELCAGMVAAGRAEVDGHRAVGSLMGVSFEDEVLTARFGLDDAGIVRFVLPLRPAGDALELIEALERSEVRTNSPEATAEARAAFAD